MSESRKFVDVEDIDDTNILPNLKFKHRLSPECLFGLFGRDIKEQPATEDDKAKQG